MKFRILKLAAATAVLATIISAPAFAEKPSFVVTDNYRVVWARVNTNLASFRGNVNVTSTDGHEDVAEKLKEQIAAAGYNVSAENPEIRYTVKEIYAGEADQYTPPTQKSGKVGLGAGLDIAASIGLCVFFGTCTDPSFMANEVLTDLDHVNRDLTSRNAADDPSHAKKPLLIVEYEVCRVGRSCANALAASYNPDVTLDQLRLVNAAEGLSRAINLKKVE
ncbi:hypothetical protein [Cupriavidus sp. TMH.W2]|uniref:hypothetical protein n=1 Tax=Cupriavidus sp. TMH.W2 TaxID=3434465 RepID=UPI003D77BD8D